MSVFNFTTCLSVELFENTFNTNSYTIQRLFLFIVYAFLNAKDRFKSLRAIIIGTFFLSSGRFTVMVKVLQTRKINEQNRRESEAGERCLTLKHRLHSG